MICSSCGGASSNSARFCGTCGNPLQRICGSCGTELGSSNLFCSACGVRVEGGSPAGSQSAPTERRLVSVVIAGVVASGALSEERDGSADGDVLSSIIEATREGVHRYAGVINHVDGDRIMALFGAREADQHHAISACFAGIDIPRLVTAAVPDARVQIGIHSGEVSLQMQGSHLASDYVASGKTVQLAAGMEHLSRPGIPLITAATASLAGHNVRLGAPQEVDVHEFETPIEVYELMGKADAAGSLQSHTAARRSQFIARVDELELLDSLRSDVDQGNGAVLTVIGGPGVGKSRLLIEFIGRLPEGVEVLSSRASPYDRSTPYRPIAEMMRSWLGRRGGGEYNAEEVLAALDPSLTVYTDALVALIGGQPPASWISIDAGLRRQTTRRAIRAILGASAAERSTVLVFEDRHWMDGESLSLMDELADLAGTTPLLMLVSSRSEGGERWDDLDHAELLELEGLMGTEVTEFVDVLVGTGSSTASIRTELSERTDGSPLFLEELVRSLADVGVLAGEHGKYKRGENDLRVEMPPDVQTVIAGRIGRLPPVAREIMELIAVHGEHAREDLLEFTTDRDDRERTEAMTVLLESEMVYADESARPMTYSFKHNLIRESAYSGIPTRQREELHARIAEGVIALEFEQDWTERLAHHTFEAGQWEDAARFALASAKRAAAKSAYRESEQFLSMSLEALALLPKNRANIEQTIDALITRRISTIGIGGRISEGFGSLDDAESLANEIGDLERVARVNLHRSYARSMTGHHQQGLIDADRAHGIGQQLGRRALTAEANLAKAQHHSFAGEPSRVGGLIGHDLTFLRDEVGRNGMAGHRIVWAHVHLAVANGLLGHFEAARQAARDAMSQARERGLALDVVNVHWATAMVEVGAEEFKRCVETCRDAADIAAAHEFAWVGNTLEIIRGYSLARLGSFDEGVALLEQSIDVGADMGAPMHMAWAKAYLSELMTSCGQNEHARSHGQSALMLARKTGMKAVEVMALQMLGRSQQLLRESKGFLEEALGLSVEYSLRPLNAQIRMELGWIVKELGASPMGDELIAEANDIRRQMGLLPFPSDAAEK